MTLYTVRDVVSLHSKGERGCKLHREEGSWQLHHVIFFFLIVRERSQVYVSGIGRRHQTRSLASTRTARLTLLVTSLSCTTDTTLTGIPRSFHGARKRIPETRRAFTADESSWHRPIRRQFPVSGISVRSQGCSQNFRK